MTHKISGSIPRVQTIDFGENEAIEVVPNKENEHVKFINDLTRNSLALSNSNFEKMTANIGTKKDVYAVTLFGEFADIDKLQVEEAEKALIPEEEFSLSALRPKGPEEVKSGAALKRLIANMNEPKIPKQRYPKEKPPKFVTSKLDRNRLSVIDDKDPSLLQKQRRTGKKNHGFVAVGDIRIKPFAVFYNKDQACEFVEKMSKAGYPGWSALRYEREPGEFVHVIFPPEDMDIVEANLEKEEIPSLVLDLTAR